jgi:DNA replication protein DnaC
MVGQKCKNNISGRSQSSLNFPGAFHWHDHIGDPTIADAIMDRLILNTHRIQLKGGSMRKET